jgi:hypothetical protein
MQISNMSKEPLGTISFKLGENYFELVTKKDKSVEIIIGGESIIIVDADGAITYLIQNAHIDEDDQLVIRNMLDLVQMTLSINWDKVTVETAPKKEFGEIINEISTGCGQNVDNSPKEIVDETRKYWLSSIAGEVVAELSNELTEALKDEVDWDRIKQSLFNLCKSDVNALAEELAPQIEGKVAEKLYAEIGDIICKDLSSGTQLDDLAETIKEDYIIGGR